MEGTIQHGGEPGLAAQFAAALDWWRDAGVDCDFADEPVQWLRPEGEEDAPPVAAIILPAAKVAPPPPALADGKAEWPATLADFSAWWMSEPLLDNGQVRDRVPPRGPVGAELMIVVPQPETADRESLLTGPEGSLISAMVKAMGLAEGAVYLASALPRHTPLADWAAIGRNGLGAVLAHHIGLVAPRRLLVLGSGIPPLLGHDLPQNAQFSPAFNHGGLSVPLLCAMEPGAMLGRGARKAAFWQRWLSFSSQIADT